MSSLEVTASSGGHRALDEGAVGGLKAALRGQLLRAGDEGYEQARKIYNAMVEKRPALIARCAGAADVIACVRFARDHDLLVAVRGGGHNVAGTATCDGFMIDLSPMKGIRVDPAARTVRVEAGLTWKEVNQELQAFGLGATGGVIGTTGVAGLTLGGGLGWLVRKHGLACDNLLSVDVVTADGTLLRASEAENSDLFWGLRGGGGNFGVVTSFEFRAHPAGIVLAGLLGHPFTQGREFLRSWRAFEATAPEEWTAGAVLATAPPAPFIPKQLHGSPIAAVAGVFAGPLESGERALRPLRGFGQPAFDVIQPMPYSAAQTMLDAMYPQGFHNYWKAQYVPTLTDPFIDVLIEHFARVPSPMTTVVLEHNGDGAVNRVDRSATAFGYRDHSYILIIMSMWADAADSDRNVAWTRALYDAVRPLARPGIYVNYLGNEGEERVKEAYGANYARLVALKRKYDPGNLFRVNQNIRPDVATAS